MLIYKFLELHINDHQYWWPQQLGLQTFIAGRRHIILCSKSIRPFQLGS